MRLALTLAVTLAGCGRIGFDAPGGIGPDPTGDGGPGDGVAGDSTGMIDSSTPGAATVAYLGTARSVQNLSTYSFSGLPIGPATANRIIVVCAYLGGGAVSPITSITLNGTALELSGSQTDGAIGGTQSFGSGLVPTGTTADITVTSPTAGRAAIAIYSITASSPTASGGAGGNSSSVNTSPISTPAVALAGGIMISAASYGSNNTTWTWGGTWMGYTENLDAVWSEQGSYTTASAATSSGGFVNVSATPQAASGKLLSVGTWR